MSVSIRPAPARRAFTLVELLVVMAIISVLLAILLPTLSRAREYARQVKCASNMRQIVLAILMYSNDNKGKLPIPALTPGNGSRPAPVTGGGDINAVYQLIAFSGSVYDGHLVYNWSQGTLWPYIDRSAGTREQLFNCPSDDNKLVNADEAAIVLWTSTPFDRNFSYTFNDLMRGIDFHTDAETKWPYPDGMRISQINHPSHKVLVTEQRYVSQECAELLAWGLDGRHALVGYTNSELVANRHLKRGNHAFADGHVEALFPEEMGCRTNQLTSNLWTNYQVMNALAGSEELPRREYYFNLFADPIE